MTRHHEANASQGPGSGPPPIGRDESLMSLRIKACREFVVQRDLHPPCGQPIERQRHQTRQQPGITGTSKHQPCSGGEFGETFLPDFNVKLMNGLLETARRIQRLLDKAPAAAK